MNLDFTTTQNQENGTPRIQPGIHDVTITSVEAGVMPYKNANGQDISCISVSFRDTSNAEHKEDFSMDPTPAPGKTKSAADWSKERLMHLGTKIMSEEDWKNNIKSVANMNAYLVGKQLRVKFGGREYEKDGSVRVAARLPLFRFAEALSVNPTQLSYNPNDPNDLRKLNGGASMTTPSVNTATAPATSNGQGTSDDLPF
jgi:hypothetical protein